MESYLNITYDGTNGKIVSFHNVRFIEQVVQSSALSSIVDGDIENNVVYDGNDNIYKIYLTCTAVR